MEYVAHGAVVQYHDLTQIRLNLGQVLDVCTIAECTMLSIISAAEVFAFSLKPVNDWIGIFLYRCCENYEVVPLAHLFDVLACSNTQDVSCNQLFEETHGSAVSRVHSTKSGFVVHIDHFHPLVLGF